MTKTLSYHAQKSANIRKLLKAAGYNAKQISVRKSSYSGGGSIRVEIKDATIPIAPIKEIAETEEHVRHCKYSGEILSGGNTFVFVDYTLEAKAEMGRPYLDAARAAVEEVKQSAANGDKSVLAKIGATDCHLGYEQEDYYRVWMQRTRSRCTCNAKSIAEIVGYSQLNPAN